VDQRKIKISKLDAARRQLDTAIRLYFTEADPVSVRTLAAAAFEIPKDLDEYGPKTGTFHDHLEANVKPEYLKRVIDIFRGPQNFFKHADTDPNDVLDFALATPEMFLISAVEKYVELAAERSAEMIVYGLWFGHQLWRVRLAGTVEKLFAQSTERLLQTARSAYI
jgi:hypothetical protein